MVEIYFQTCTKKFYETLRRIYVITTSVYLLNEETPNIQNFIWVLDIPRGSSKHFSSKLVLKFSYSTNQKKPSLLEKTAKRPSKKSLRTLQTTEPVTREDERDQAHRRRVVEGKRQSLIKFQFSRITGGVRANRHFLEGDLLWTKTERKRRFSAKGCRRDRRLNREKLFWRIGIAGAQQLALWFCSSDQSRSLLYTDAVARNCKREPSDWRKGLRRTQGNTFYHVKRLGFFESLFKAVSSVFVAGKCGKPVK